MALCACTCTSCYAVDVHISAHHLQSHQHMHTMKTRLSPEDLLTASNEAEEFIAENGDCGLSFETVLVLCFINQRTQSAPTPARNPVAEAIARRATAGAQPAAIDAIPEWFSEGVKRYAGRKMTASAILTGMGRATDIKSLREAGAWLRQLYGEPSRSGGQTLFSVFGHVTGALAQAPADDDEAEANDPYAKRLPLSTKVQAFAAREQHGRYMPAEIARILKHEGTQLEINEVGKTLYDMGYEFDNSTGHYDLGLNRNR